MNYQEWAQRVPPEIKGDSVWKSEVYRLALFAADLGWSDATKLLGDKRTISLADQLYRAVGAVAATWRRVIPEALAGIAHGSTSMHLAQRAKPGAGISREDTFWARQLPIIECVCSPKSSSYS